MFDAERGGEEGLDGLVNGGMMEEWVKGEMNG